MQAKKTIFFQVAVLLLFLLTNGAYAVIHITQHVERVSVSSDGEEADRDSEYPAISADGQYIAFRSIATNLVAGDTNGAADIFVHDRTTGTTERISVNTTGEEAMCEVDGISGYCGGANGAFLDSSLFAISADGRYVVFGSNADNLVDGDSSELYDIFVRDRVMQSTELVSISSSGGGADHYSYSSDISADGRFVAFVSRASNLIEGDSNGYRDIFVRDRLTQSTERVSVSSSGGEANGESGSPCISADGRYVAFGSEADNLVDGDSNRNYEIFIRDRLTQSTERVSVSSSGGEANSGSSSPSISADGRYVAFQSHADNLVDGDSNGNYDIFVRDRLTQTTERVSVAGSPGISADGRYVIFESTDSNLVSGDTNGKPDIFLRDLFTHTTRRISVSSDGEQSTSESYSPAISADGQYIAFYSSADNLVAGDTNESGDIFIYQDTSYNSPDQMAPILHLMLKDDPADNE